MEVIFKTKGNDLDLTKMDLLQLIELGDLLYYIKTHDSLELLEIVMEFIDEHFHDLYNALDHERKQALQYLLKAGANHEKNNN